MSDDIGYFPDQGEVYDPANPSETEYFTDGTQSYFTDAANPDSNEGFVPPADYDDPYLHDPNAN